MIKLRHQQPSLWHSGLAADIEDLWEPWMRLVDGLLEDEQLLETIYEAQGERYPQSRRRGREQTPAEVVLRLLLLKHIRNWSYDVLEREVRANLASCVYAGGRRESAGCQDHGAAGAAHRAGSDRGVASADRAIGARTRSDAWAKAAGRYHGGGNQHPLSDRQQFVGGRHAGADADDEEDRAESRRPEAQGAGSHAECAEAGSGDCPIDPVPGAGRRSAQKEAVWRTAESNPENRKPSATHIRRVKNVPRAGRLALRSLVETLATMTGRVQQVITQTKLRIFAGVTKSQEKIVSMFEPHTEIIRKGKASKPPEFGKLVK